VLVGGRAESIANLESFLPPRVRERLVLAEDLQPTLAEDQLRQAADEALADLVIDEGTARVRALEELEPGRAAFGADPVLAALNESRVSRLYLGERLCQDGWSCAACTTVGEGAEPLCPECGAPTDADELGEAMLRRALAQDATVEVLADATGIARRGGVAAELRYPTLH
jgi:peptide subunit release factor 1 (eRF1)